MKYMKYLKENDAIQTALNLPEPEVGKKYADEEVERYLKIIQTALEAMKNKKENDTNDSIEEDLRDKKSKWENVDKETKPAKTKPTNPPGEQEIGGGEKQPPPNENIFRNIFK